VVVLVVVNRVSWRGSSLGGLLQLLLVLVTMRLVASDEIVRMIDFFCWCWVFELSMFS